MKIVKLDINEDSFLSGLDAVALVEYPAIEEDFFMFNKQEFKTFSHDEVEQLVIEDVIKKHLFDVDTSGLSNYINELPDETQNLLIEKLSEVGETMDGWVECTPEEAIKEAFASIKSTPDDSSIADFGTTAVRYRYTGPYDSRNRTFCRQLMTLDLVFRREDINRLAINGANQEFGVYDVFAYKGSFNCRHYWQEVFYKRDSKINNNSEPEAISNRILDGTTRNLPVIQKDGVADKQVFSALIDKQMVIGPLMTPNKLIKRIDDEGEEYFVYFDEPTIEKIAYKFMEDKLVDRVNIEHNSDEMVNDAYLVEGWIVKDPEKDKSNYYGFKPIKGQWFGMYKIKNKKIWDEYIKSGKVKGFSVEGMFNDTLLTNAKIQKVTEYTP